VNKPFVLMCEHAGKKRDIGLGVKKLLPIYPRAVPWWATACSELRKPDEEM